MKFRTAERQGFEPWRGCPQHAFQACALSRSATSPSPVGDGCLVKPLQSLRTLEPLLGAANYLTIRDTPKPIFHVHISSPCAAHEVVKAPSIQRLLPGRAPQHAKGVRRQFPRKLEVMRSRMSGGRRFGPTRASAWSTPPRSSCRARESRRTQPACGSWRTTPGAHHRARTGSR